jgi:hypothetical protein
MGSMKGQIPIIAAALALTASVAYGQSYDGRYDAPGASYRDSYVSRPGAGWYPDWGADPNYTYYGGWGRDAGASGRGAWRPDWQDRQAYAPAPGVWHPDWGADTDVDGQYVDPNAGRIFHDRYGRAYTVDQYGISRWIQ